VRQADHSLRGVLPGVCVWVVGMCGGVGARLCVCMCGWMGARVCVCLIRNLSNEMALALTRIKLLCKEREVPH
jgi:hypothetical protein